MDDYSDLSSSTNLIAKLQTYFPKLTNDVSDIEKSFMFVIKNYPKEFGKNLSKIRDSKNINQLAFSKYLNISRPAYTSWELGTHVPRLYKVKEIISLLQIDPADLISTNPIQFDDSSSVSLLTSEFFVETRLEVLESKIKSAKNLERIRVPLGESHSFAFMVQNEDMVGNSKFIPNNTVLLCSSNSLKDASTESKRLNLVNNKIAIVSICGGPALVRELSFDGNMLSLTAWNGNILTLRFPLDISSSNSSATLFHNQPTSTSSVQIYGIVEYVIFNYL